MRELANMKMNTDTLPTYRQFSQPINVKGKSYFIWQFKDATSILFGFTYSIKRLNE